jgi:hypothetical protein
MAKLKQELLFVLGEHVVGILEKTFYARTQADIEHVLDMFNDLEFILRLRSRLLQQHCCRFFRVMRMTAGEPLYKQGDVGNTMYIVINGSMTVEKWRGSENKRQASKSRGEESRCRIGQSFGENCLTANSEFGRRRQSSVIAHESSIVAVLSRDNYLQITRTSELQGYIDSYWDMLMNDAYGNARGKKGESGGIVELCDQRLYTKLHLAIGKTLHDDWEEGTAAIEVQSDWMNDIQRHNLGSDVLNHR